MTLTCNITCAPIHTHAHPHSGTTQTHSHPHTLTHTHTQTHTHTHTHTANSTHPRASTVSGVNSEFLAIKSLPTYEGRPTRAGSANNTPRLRATAAATTPAFTASATRTAK